ncbi:hypothetical protein [Prochlorococcus sp. MIT 1223]|uniref:hypothetical protein n=1 Tax=Prochlorococcus sp. MIT 1223 TaxID=3096217 RepID=UPI002A74BF82|nr:hypothetical protein [Prochlorococcus sp. MIT 1223]
MNSSDTLLRAALNRLSARLGKKIVNTAAEIAVLAKDAPDQLKKEWEILKEEIYEEAEKLKSDSNNEKRSDSDFSEEFDSSFSEEFNSDQIRDKIDRIRGKVAALNKKI